MSDSETDDDDEITTQPVNFSNVNDSNDKKMRKTKWTESDDLAMTDYVNTYPSVHKVKWPEVATQLNNGKNGKQCRERWHTHLDPSIRKGKWDENELATLLEAHDTLGTRWTEIIKRLPGRSANDAKNTLHSLKRKTEKIFDKEAMKAPKLNP